jgi:alanyl-tRNA synthetase
MEQLEKLSHKKYDDNAVAMRVIADHLRGAAFLATDGVTPSNKGQGYVMRRLLRRAIRYALEIGIEQGLCENVAPIIASVYRDDFPEVLEQGQKIIDILIREEKIFRQTLRSGLGNLQKMARDKMELTGRDIFVLYDTYGFPVELAIEEADKQGIKVNNAWKKTFEENMTQQRERSRTATAGEFKGGLADASEMTTKLHTAAHLLDAALHQVLGETVTQRGSNINVERLRYDFSHPQKVIPEEIAKIEQIVNETIDQDLPVTWAEENTAEALKSGAIGAFGHKYGDKVKVYTIGDKNHPFNREICGGPHVEHTSQLAEGGKHFKITKEEASSAGVRRIKAVLI